MPTRTLYVSADDQATWDEAARICKRRNQSVSALLTGMLRDWVADNTTGVAAEMGLPAGFRTPKSMVDPVQEEIDQLASDFQAQVRDLLAEKLMRGRS